MTPPVPDVRAIAKAAKAVSRGPRLQTFRIYEEVEYEVRAASADEAMAAFLADPNKHLVAVTDRQMYVATGRNPGRLVSAEDYTEGAA